MHDSKTHFYPTAASLRTGDRLYRDGNPDDILTVTQIEQSPHTITATLTTGETITYNNDDLIELEPPF